jgi:hypothetical protein
MNIFSFCLYGTDLKYYLGLDENLKLINEHFSDYFIYIYVGKTRREEYLIDYKQKYSNVRIIETYKDGAVNMLYRYKPLLLSGINRVIIRDADSEVNERDRHCINDFIHIIDKDYICQVIRDNYWHKSKITGGLSFFKNINSDNINKGKWSLLQYEFTKLFAHIENTFIEGDDKYIYGTDENILNENVYPLIKENILVYTNICAFQGENYKYIDFKNDGYNFCGNVIDYIPVNNDNVIINNSNGNNSITYIKNPQFNYFKYNIVEQLQWLSLQAQHDLMLKIVDEYGLNNCDYSLQSRVLDYCFIAHFYNKNLQGCMNICKQFYKYEIPAHFKSNVKYFYDLARELNYKIIGTCNISYTPQVNEIVIYYGNYPDDYMALPQSNRIYKHTLYKDDIRVDEFKCASCWNRIDKIFIMGLENEFERTNDTILQLSLMNAPLNKIHVYKAKKDINLNDVYIGATKNHIDCLKMMLDVGYETCLFLEDDFIFTSSIEENKQKLACFIERNYDYDICFLSASKYHRRDEFDDLLILSKQVCTTSSGYLINKRNVKKVYNAVVEGYELLLRNKEHSHLYCIDRYWTTLQKDNKMFIFKDKLGFQKPSKSKITGKLNCELD